MKKHLQSAFCLGAAAALMVSTALNAQEWETVFSGLPGVGGDIGTDTSGSSVITAGRFINETTGDSMAVVLGLDDQTGDWVPLDAYAEDGLNYAHNRAFAADPVTGALFAGGNLNNMLPDGTYDHDALWFIREGDPQTGEWTTVDDSQALLEDGLGQASCADILVTPSGDVYAAGGGQVGWLVRKRSANTQAFVAADVDHSGQSSGSVWDMAYHPTYGVFAVGDLNGFWTVRRSADNGATWETVDSFGSAEWSGGSAHGIAVADSGTIYVTGWAYYSGRKGSGYRWLVRTSNNGVHWVTSDNTTLGVSGGGVAVDANGKPYVCGYGNGNWLVRTLSESTTTKKGKPVTTLTWTTIDQFQLAPGQEARANAVTVNAQGDVYVSGRGVDATGVSRFVVRKLLSAGF